MKETCKKLKQPFLRGLADTDAYVTRQESINHLRSWLDTQPHLPQLTDEHLVMFLHSRYDNLERTKQTIESYYTFRTLTPELFSNRDPQGQDVDDICNICELVVLPEVTPDAYRVAMFRFTDYTASKYFLVPSFKAFLMSADFHISEYGLVHGVVVVFDMKGISIFHLFRVHPLSMVKKILHYIQECLPVRLKSVHLINATFLTGKLLALVKPFLKKEAADKMHVHTSAEELEDFFPLDILPQEYGGKGDSITYTYIDQKNRFQTEYQEWFLQGEDLKSDESKRLI